MNDSWEKIDAILCSQNIYYGGDEIRKRLGDAGFEIVRKFPSEAPRFIENDDKPHPILQDWASQFGLQMQGFVEFEDEGFHYVIAIATNGDGEICKNTLKVRK